MATFRDTINYYALLPRDFSVASFYEEFIKTYRETLKKQGRTEKSADVIHRRYEKLGDAFFDEYNVNEYTTPSFIQAFSTYFVRNSACEIVPFQKYPYLYVDPYMLAFGGKDEASGDLLSFMEFFELDKKKVEERFMAVANKKGVFDLYLHNYVVDKEDTQGLAGLTGKIREALRMNSVDIRNMTRVYEIAMNVNIVYCASDAYDHTLIWNYNDSGTFMVERPTRFVYISEGHRFSEVFFVDAVHKKRVSYSENDMSMLNMRVYQGIVDVENRVSHGSFMRIQNEPSDYGQTLPRITLPVDDSTYTFLVGRTGNLYLEKQPSVLIGRIDVIQKVDSDGKGVANVHLIDGYRALL